MEGEEEWPADTSSLIYVAKCDAFAEIRRCVPMILVPDAVWAEAVDAGDAVGAPEVPLIRDAVRGGFARRESLSSREEAVARSLVAAYRLGKGESEVLALARSLGRCIVDEGKATRIAVSLGIRSISTMLFPVLGHRQGRLSLDEARGLARRLAIVAGARADVLVAIEAALSGGKS